jgi:TetR/AcrR family transcriptional regulator
VVTKPHVTSTPQKGARKLTFEHYLRLPKEKQQIIFEASLTEFADHGYDLASTNRITERAGISKGVLFKYFSSKEGLFDFVCERSAETMLAALHFRVEELPTDFFEALQFFAQKEIEFLQLHPVMSRLFEHIAEAPAHPVYHKVAVRLAEGMQGNYLQMFSVVSTASLRPDVTIEQALMLVNWVVTGAKKSLMATRPPSQEPAEQQAWREQAMAEISSYFELLKRGLYREESAGSPPDGSR